MKPSNLNKMQISNGDVFDLSQTINGVSTFLWFNDKWYYFMGRMTREYEYDQQDLTDLVTENEFKEIKHVANILQSVENYENNNKSTHKILPLPKIRLSEIEIDKEADEEFQKIEHSIENEESIWKLRIGFMTGYTVAKNKYKK